MEPNFFDERVNRWYNPNLGKDMIKKFIKIMSPIWVPIIIITIRANDILGAIYLTILDSSFIFLITAILTPQRKWTVYRQEQLLNKFHGVNGLLLCNVREKKQDVYYYINDAIENNEIIFRHKAFPKRRRVKSDDNSEVILLSKYLLDCNKRTVTAVPIEYVERVVVEECEFKFPKVQKILDKPEFAAHRGHYRGSGIINGFFSSTGHTVHMDKEYVGIPENGETDSKNFIKKLSPVVSIYYGNRNCKKILCKSQDMANNLANEINLCLSNLKSETNK